MVRTEGHVEDEETRDSSSPMDDQRVGPKANALRSKHSETEQRRRSKINERFQILRDLIPENDQKRDKASLLLEVIQYIQFLHEKLQMYEGSCQGWSLELAKSLPRRINSGLVENFVDQSQLDRNLSAHEDDVIHPTLLSEVQNSVESDLDEAALYTSTDNTPVATKTLPLNMPLETSIFEGVLGQPHQGCFPDADQLTHQSHFWSGRSCGDDCSVPLYSANEEELKCDTGESSISNAYSQRLLNSLTNALQSSGVDLSQASISVQLDVGKQTNGGSTRTMTNTKDDENAACLKYGAPMDIGWNYGHPHKRVLEVIGAVQLGLLAACMVLLCQWV